jgi:hypothetical protein
VTVNRSNVAIEAHFRTVKHGRVGGRRSVGPKQFIDAELAYVNGKLNEARLPTRRTTATHRLPDLEETWRSRGSGRRSNVAAYYSPATAATVIAAVGRRAGRGRVRGSGRGAPQSLSAASIKPLTSSASVTLPATTASRTHISCSETSTSTAVTPSMPSTSITRQDRGQLIDTDLFKVAQT